MFDRAPGSPGRPAPTRNGARVLLHRGLPLPPTGLLSQARQSSLRFACEEGAKLRSQWHIELAGSGRARIPNSNGVYHIPLAHLNKLKKQKEDHIAQVISSSAEQQQVIFNTIPKRLKFDETRRAVRFNETLRHQSASNFQEFFTEEQHVSLGC